MNSIEAGIAHNEVFQPQVDAQPDFSGAKETGFIPSGPQFDSRVEKPGFVTRAKVGAGVMIAGVATLFGAACSDGGEAPDTGVAGATIGPDLSPSVKIDESPTVFVETPTNVPTPTEVLPTPTPEPEEVRPATVEDWRVKIDEAYATTSIPGNLCSYGIMEQALNNADEARAVTKDSVGYIGTFFHIASELQKIGDATGNTDFNKLVSDLTPIMKKDFINYAVTALGYTTEGAEQRSINYFIATEQNWLNRERVNYQNFCQISFDIPK